VKFFNIDVHISVIEDIKGIFKDLGHTVDSLLLSDHYWVFREQKDDIKVINRQNWKHIDKDLCDKFYYEYKDELEKYDGFIVTYPPVFSMLFERFNKPIIIVAATRYEYPYTFDRVKWSGFNHFLQTNENVTLVSNNKYDKKYCELFLNIPVKLIESYCSYTNREYNPVKEQSILFSKKDLSNYVFTREVLNKNSLGAYSFEQLFSYHSIIHFPYNISTMSIFEQYCANMPLFFPTKRLLEELFETDIFPLTEVSFKRVFNAEPNSTLAINGDPNEWNNFKIFKEWVCLADFYNFKHINFYDNLLEINEIPYLDKEQLIKNSKLIKDENMVRKDKIYNLWREVLGEIF
jgi:hypothetical protein